MASVVKKSTDGSQIVATDDVKAQNAALFAADPDTDTTETDRARLETTTNGAGGNGADPVQVAASGNGPDPVRAAPTDGNVKVELTEPANAGGNGTANTIADAIKVSGGAKSVFSNLAAISITGSTNIGQKLVSRNVPIRKPGALEYFRTHPAQCLDTIVVEDKENREVYFATPAVMGVLVAQGLAKTKRLVRIITRQGVNAVWPIGIEDDGRINSWYESAREAETRARTCWTRIVSNMPCKAYDIYASADPCDEPDWTSQSFEEILEIAFKGRVIDSPDHRILRGWIGQQVS
jgi:hypothetical protein